MGNFPRAHWHYVAEECPLLREELGEDVVFRRGVDGKLYYDRPTKTQTSYRVEQAVVSFTNSDCPWCVTEGLKMLARNYHDGNDGPWLVDAMIAAVGDVKEQR